MYNKIPPYMCFNYHIELPLIAKRSHFLHFSLPSFKRNKYVVLVFTHNISNIVYHLKALFSFAYSSAFKPVSTPLTCYLLYTWLTHNSLTSHFKTHSMIHFVSHLSPKLAQVGKFLKTHSSDRFPSKILSIIKHSHFGQFLKHTRRLNFLPKSLPKHAHVSNLLISHTHLFW